MKLYEILLLAVSLSMDAFAVSICKGLTLKKIDYKKASIVGGYFGFFQAFMPLIGYFLGSLFKELIMSVDHWIAFILLTLIGINMIREAIKGDEENTNDKVDFKTMIVPAIATSIDALVVGITFALLETNIWLSIILIGITTFIFSFVGVIIGNKVGNKFEKTSKILGGVVLICLGLKTLLEHLNIF